MTTRTTQNIFDRFAERLGWDFGTQADVLVNWCGDENIIELLLQHIEVNGQTDDFEEFLTDNFGDEQPEVDGAERPDWQREGF